MQNNNIPKIRFNGFTAPWEQRKLEDVARILGGNAWKASDYSDDGEYLVVTIANVSGEVIINDSVGNRISCDNPDVYLLNKGDILVSLTGNVGRVSKMSNIKGLLNQRVGKILPNNSDINADFLFHVLRNPHFERAMIDAGQGAAQKNIRNDDVLNYAFFLPVEKDEQNIIAHYFNRLDNLITLHQRKYDKLTNVKKSMLEKLFPKNGASVPKIRFKGFSDAWEQRKLGEIFEEYSEKGHPELPALTIIQGGGTIRRDESDRSLQYDRASLSNYKMVNDGDFIVHLRSFEGGLEKSTTLGIISPAYHTFHGEGTDSRFYYSYFRSPKFIDQDLKPHVYGIRDGRSIDIEGMKTIEIPWTSFDEQKAIGDYIDTLDNLITLHQCKLEKLKHIKQACLEQMFL